MRKIILIVSLLLINNCIVVGLFVPPVEIWLAETKGRAQLAEAEFSKKIAIETSKAKLESSELEGQAEIIRAEAAAKANKILGDSLKNNEAYLRYLWIHNINATKEVYYIPTEAGLPILEAGKRK